MRDILEYGDGENLEAGRLLPLESLEEDGDKVGGGKVCLVLGVYNDGGGWLLLEGEGLERGRV